MKLTKQTLYQLLSSRFPTAYNDFSGKATLPKAPYIAYLSTGFDTISADDRTYFKKEHFSVELYTEKNDLTSEETLEKILGGAGIYYRKQGQQWLDDVNKYVTIYTM